MKPSDAQNRIESTMPGREQEVRPLSDAELDQVSGGIIAILIGLAVSPVQKRDQNAGHVGQSGLAWRDKINEHHTRSHADRMK